jgi:hypothetical protein
LCGAFPAKGQDQRCGFGSFLVHGVLKQSNTWIEGNSGVFVLLFEAKNLELRNSQ